PVLVLYSSKSVTPGNYKQEMHTSDSVLDVADIEKYSNGIGKRVQKVEIKDGVHDLTLSKPDAKEKTFNEMTSFINSIK
ncbi:MAG: alpha/beta hydrolase, partial [Flavobacteriales bacterium]|nr:alpha/beta hydrolase [Flavobacteriales bacterium]